jgi:integral membrane protein
LNRLALYYFAAHKKIPTATMPGSNLNRLRILAYLEGISFLILLGVTMPLKYFYEMPTPNIVIGMIHGLLFIAYCSQVFIVRSEEKWKASKTFWALLASLLPFGTFVADAKLFRK